MKNITIKIPDRKTAHTEIQNDTLVITFNDSYEYTSYPTQLSQLIPQTGYYLNNDGKIVETSKHFSTSPHHMNSEEDAKAIIALIQLIRFKKAWNKECPISWKTCKDEHWSIYRHMANIKVRQFTDITSVLTFKTRELAERFKTTFGDLLEQAKMII